MICVSKYILTIGILLTMTVCCATAAIPQVCQGCNPDTYPGSETCHLACRIAFPADAKWTYPVVEDVEEEVEDVEETPDYLTSPLSGITFEIPVIDPDVSKLSGNKISDPVINPIFSALSVSGLES